MINATKKLLRILDRKQKHQVVLLVLMMLVGGVMESVGVSLMLPLITGIMYENEWKSKWYAKIICNLFHIGSQRSYIIVLLVALILVFIIKNAYLMVEYNVQYGFIAKSRYQLQQNLIHQYMRVPYAFYLNANSGEIIRVLSNDTFYTFTLLTSLLCIYTEVIVSAILIVTIILISPQIAFWMAIFLIVEVLLIWKVIKPIMRREGQKLLKENGASNSWALQIINGIKSIKVSHTEGYFEKNYNEHAYAAVDASRKNQTYSVVPRLLIEAVTVMAVLTMILFQLLAGMDVMRVVPQLSAFVVAAVRLLPSVNRISTNINQIPYYEDALNTVLHALEDEEYNIGKVIRGFSSKKVDGQSTKSVKIDFENKVVVDHVTFSYPNSETEILKDAYLEIAKGQSVGIVGTSGAGKTTIVDIMLGLLKPKEGAVRVDGTDIEDSLPAWLGILSYIPQNIFLIDDSVRKNVAFGIDEQYIDDGEVWRALKEAQMEEFVRSLPDGLDTGVGEKGIRLSGGQCQRIGIARALYNDPEILFFDEATSSLDNETESAIMEAIESLKGYKTLVVIAHRLTTIKNCDVVYRIEEGKAFKD